MLSQRNGGLKFLDDGVIGSERPSPEARVREGDIYSQGNLTSRA